MDPQAAFKPKIPNVQIFENMPSSPAGFKKAFNQGSLPVRLIYIILVLVILVEIFLGIKTLLTPLPKVAKLQPVSDGRIILSATKNSFNVGQRVGVNIKTSTGGHTSVGTDVVLHFDPTFLEAQDPKSYQTFKLFSDYPGTSIDNNKGVILISGITTSNQGGFNGTGKFATVYLRAKKAGKTEVTLDFKKGSTVDSNIIETDGSKDVLGEVYNLELNIGGANKEMAALGKVCKAFKQICWGEDGKQGTQTCNGGTIKEGYCSFDPYLTDSCSKCQTSERILP